jgi:formylglycine-generating enzyme required for sulfatase activity
LAPLGLAAWAVAMIQIGEFALAQILFTLSAVAFLVQIYLLKIPLKRWKVIVIKTILTLIVIVAYVIFTVINIKIKGAKPWSNLWAEDQPVQNVEPRPAPVLWPSPVMTPTATPTPEHVKPPDLHPFDFDVAAVDAEGKQIERHKEQKQYFIEDLGGGVRLNMVLVPGDTFLMGSSKSEARLAFKDAKRYVDIGLESFMYETPQHWVTVRTFFMGMFEVTQEQWRAVVDIPDPSDFSGNDSHPVEQVTWDEAMKFCASLSKATGRKYRLPTEAEWEYACRAGTTTPFAFGETITPELVNYQSEHPFGKAQPQPDKYLGATMAVGFLGVANGFGLYDMHGNVMEWCSDMWQKNYNGAVDPRYRVARGGGFPNDAFNCRCAYRDKIRPKRSQRNIGFRVVAEVQP